MLSYGIAVQIGSRRRVVRQTMFGQRKHGGNPNRLTSSLKVTIQEPWLVS